jgi:hypothetical protein
MIGRSAGLLVELPVELYAARWRIAARSGVDLRRTRDLLERDLDQLTEQADGYAGPFKVQAAGPWTLAAGLDRPIGGPMLGDPGAVRDLTASLPGAAVVLQLDEPSLPAVLAGQVPTESGLSRLPAVEQETAATAVRAVIEKVGVPVVVHCCAARVPVDLIRSAGAAAVGLDLALLDDLDPLGEAIDAGVRLLAGANEPSAKDLADRVRELWQRLGFPLSAVAAQVVVTPACGLAGATPDRAREALRACREAARRLSEED